MNETKWSCAKCGKTFDKSNDLKRHNERKFTCDLYSNKVNDAVIQSNIIEDAVCQTDISLLNNKMDSGFKLLNDKIDILMSLLMKKEEVVSPVILTTTQQYINDNKVDLSHIRTLKEDVVNLKSICSVNTTTITTPVSTEKDKYIQQPIVEKDKELSVLVVSNQKKTKKPKITYIPGVEDVYAPTNKQFARQFTPIIIPENLKSLKDKMIYINDTYEPTTNLFSNVTEFYKSNELFEFDDDTSKIYIRKNKVEYLIGECSNKCKSKSFITELFCDFINQQTKPLFYYDGIHLFIVDEQCFFDEDINNSVSNPIACKFLDTFNSILAYTAIREKDKQNILFDIKHTNITCKVFNDIVVKIITMQCVI